MENFVDCTSLVVRWVGVCFGKPEWPGCGVGREELLDEGFGGEEDSDHTVAVEAAYHPFVWFVGATSHVGV